MATITRHKADWYVQVRRKGYPARSRTFPNKREAAAWAVEQEAALANLEGACASSGQWSERPIAKGIRGVLTD